MSQPVKRFDRMQPHDFPRKLGSRHVVVRIVLRLIIIASLAALGGPGFVKILGVLLIWAAFYCVLRAVVRREPIRDLKLTHWDEAAFYLLVGAIAALLS